MLSLPPVRELLLLRTTERDLAFSCYFVMFGRPCRVFRDFLRCTNQSKDRAPRFIRKVEPP